MSKPEPLLWLSDARGVYIPRDFASSFANRDHDVIGVLEDDWIILEAGPDGPTGLYWDAWEDVLNNAVVTDTRGVRYRLRQDGDLWLIPEGMEWNDKEECFQWSEPETTA